MFSKSKRRHLPFNSSSFLFLFLRKEAVFCSQSSMLMRSCSLVVSLPPSHCLIDTRAADRWWVWKRSFHFSSWRERKVQAHDSALGYVKLTSNRLRPVRTSDFDIQIKWALQRPPAPELFSSLLYHSKLNKYSQKVNTRLAI